MAHTVLNDNFDFRSAAVDVLQASYAAKREMWLYIGLHPK